MSPIIHTIIEKYLPQAINSYLALDPESAQRLGALNGKIVTIEFSSQSAGNSIQLHFTQTTILLRINHFSKPDIIIKSTPLSFLTMALMRKNRKQFFSNNTIIIEGDVALGQQVIALFDELEIDWEEYLSHGLGDIGSHQLVRFTKKIRRIGTRVSSTLAENINDYVHEETYLFPPNEALCDFYHDVDDLRMDTDRLEARIEKLRRDQK